MRVHDEVPTYRNGILYNTVDVQHASGFLTKSVSIISYLSECANLTFFNVRISVTGGCAYITFLRFWINCIRRFIVPYRNASRQWHKVCRQINDKNAIRTIIVLLQKLMSEYEQQSF